MLAAPGTTIPENHRAALREQLGKAQCRAREVGDEIIFRVHLALPPAKDGGQDPWAILSATSVNGFGHAYWNDGRAGYAWAARGVLVDHYLAPGERFGEASGLCAQLLQRSFDVPLGPDDRVTPDIPLAIAGFSFSEMPPGGPWRGWPSGFVRVPRVVIASRYKDGGQTLAAISATIRGDSIADEIFARLVADIEHILSASAQKQAPDVPKASWPLPAQSAESLSHWCERVYGARGAVRGGRFSKVVLARSLEIDAPEGQYFSPLGTLLRLRHTHRDSVTFGLGVSGQGFFLGATPETLVEVRGRAMQTVALAGTVGRGANDDEDKAFGERLLASAKDNHEHRLVVDALERFLAEHCGDLHTDAQPSLYALSNLQHLETHLRGELRQPGGILGLVEALHPTPAVGGWPRVQSARWLDREEPLERGYYAAPVGWFTGGGDGKFVVAIRSALMHGRKIWAYAGAGIVNASDPNEEWRETELKFGAFCDDIVALPLSP